MDAALRFSGIIKVLIQHGVDFIRPVGLKTKTRFRHNLSPACLDPAFCSPLLEHLLPIMRADATPWTVPCALTLWCAALLGLRMERSGSLLYGFLLWNLFLAWIPWLTARAFRASSQRRSPRLLRCGWFTLWLLFLPNAPYILTDLLHLAPRPPVPLWYDLALLFSCAGTGLLLGYVSLLEVQGAVEEQLGRMAGWIVAAGSLFLSGFGIYLGRFLRRNSWDPLTDPAGLFLDVSDRLSNPASHPRTYAVTLIFGSGLLLGYVALRVASRSERSLTPKPHRTRNLEHNQ